MGRQARNGNDMWFVLQWAGGFWRRGRLHLWPYDSNAANNVIAIAGALTISNIRTNAISDNANNTSTSAFGPPPPGVLDTGRVPR